jgi:urease accessory protein
VRPVSLRGPSGRRTPNRCDDVEVVTIERIVGWELDAAIADQLHRLAHDGLVDELVLDADDAARHRLRATTMSGLELAIALPRDDHLADGAVLLLQPDRAVVVRLTGQRWLQVTPADVHAALELGHRAGHLHWRVRFEGPTLAVAINSDGIEERARLRDLVEAGRVSVQA